MSATGPRVALVTGGAAGIGRACVERLLRDGLSVVFTDSSHNDGRQLCAALEPRGERLLFEHGDVRDAAHLRQAVQRATAAWGHLDVLIANAGVQTPGTLLETSEEVLQKVLDINFKGVWNACGAALPAMRPGGAVVVISSINALLGFPGMAAYDASKAALLALVRHIAVEHGCDGIRANAVCPGATVTDFHLRNAAARGVDDQALRAQLSGYGLLGRGAEPSEIAAAAAFLAGEDASFVTGQTLIVDGGYTAAGNRG